MFVNKNVIYSNLNDLLLNLFSNLMTIFYSSIFTKTVTPNPENSSTVHYCFVGSVDLLEPARDVDNGNNADNSV